MYFNNMVVVSPLLYGEAQTSKATQTTKAEKGS